MADNEDFLRQLAFEEKEKHAQQNTSQPHVHIDPNDGTCYEWDYERNAWFPKVTDDFLAAYQASYGTQGGNATIEAKPVVMITENKPPIAKGGKREKGKPDASNKEEQPGWFEVDDKHNTNVYVSNLPTDITEDEFIEFMSKCGIIMKDPDTGKLKIKLYEGDSGELKGDGRCCYIKVESVDLALKILDGAMLRDKEVHVERATFQLKGQYDPSKKPKKRKAKEKNKIVKLQTKLLDWKPERHASTRAKYERTVIIKNMFDVKEFETDATLILDYQNDLREECSKFGEVRKVVIYDRHPEGIASLTFKEAEMADECIIALNGRWFAGRKLSAEQYDGKTKYSVQETEAEQQQRMKQWETYLDTGNTSKNASS